MTFAQALALIGALFTINCLLIGYLWRDQKQRIDALEALYKSTEQAVLAERVRVMEKYLDRISHWKHEKAEPYINDMENMNRRVDLIERKVFNGH